MGEVTEKAIAYLERRGIRWQMVQEIVKIDESRPHYPITLPLRNSSGNIVGTERRAIAADADPKVKTDPGSVKKGSTFGALSGDATRVWIVEGLTDYLAAETMIGILGGEVLGVPGVGLAESAIEARARQLRGKIVFISFDNDPDGRRATETAKVALEKAGARPAIANYPDGYKDLCELVEKLKVDGAEKVIAAAFAAAGEKAHRSPLRSYTVAELNRLAQSRPPRQLIVKPFLAWYESTFLYGYKGHGKTWGSLGIAMVCAQGEGGQFLKFEGAGPGVPTLYVDGEMFTIDLDQRVQDIRNSSPGLDPGDRLHLWTPDAQDDNHTVLNLFSEEGQRMLEDHIADIYGETGQVIGQVFIDNMASLLHGWEENKQESWIQIAPWLLRLRAMRIGNFWVHHAGKTLDYRGHSAMIGAMHTVLKVARPEDVQPGAAFDFTYEYTRAKPAELENFNARLEGNVWTVESLAAVADELVKKFTVDEHLGPTEIGRRIGKSKDAVMRSQKRLGLRLPSGKSGWSRNA